MMGNDKTAKLQLLLCELKLEQRHVNTDMSRLIRQGKTIDFFKAKQLNARKSGLAEKINKVENSMKFDIESVSTPESIRSFIAPWNV